jgi:hypothetical protein
MVSGRGRQKPKGRMQGRSRCGAFYESAKVLVGFSELVLLVGGVVGVWLESKVCVFIPTIMSVLYSRGAEVQGAVCLDFAMNARALTE